MQDVAREVRHVTPISLEILTQRRRKAAPGADIEASPALGVRTCFMLRDVTDLCYNRSMKKIACIVLAAFLSGCMGTRVVEGVDLAVGVDIPGADGAIQFTLFNYLSGLKMSVTKNSTVDLDYKAYTTSWFWGVKSNTRKHIKTKVRPCVEIDVPTQEEQGQDQS